MEFSHKFSIINSICWRCEVLERNHAISLRWFWGSCCESVKMPYFTTIDHVDLLGRWRKKQLSKQRLIDSNTMHRTKKAIGLPAASLLLQQIYTLSIGVKREMRNRDGNALWRHIFRTAKFPYVHVYRIACRAFSLRSCMHKRVLFTLMVDQHLYLTERIAFVG